MCEFVNFAKNVAIQNSEILGGLFTVQQAWMQLIDIKLNTSVPIANSLCMYGILLCEN